MVQPWNLGGGAFDFTPLGNIVKNFMDGYDRGRRMTAIDRLGGELTSPNPDYRKAAAYALDAGESGSAIGLLGLAQKDREAQLGRLADVEVGSALAALTGGGGAARPRLLSDIGTNGAGRPVGRPLPSEGGGAPPGLIGGESGGRWNAQNSAVGAGGKVGHFGRIQFGQERLQDAMNAGAIPQGTTPQQFMSSPELQQQAERWHWADIENNIRQNGFDRMIGQNINGVPVTMDGMKAVAHLGGSEGLKKFIETGGRYNPADVNGTRLSDYFSRMGGNGGAQIASAAPGQDAAAADAQRAGAQGGPRMVLSPQYPAVQANAQPGGDVYDDPNVPDQGAGVPLAYKTVSSRDQGDTAGLSNSSGIPNSTSAPASSPRTIGGPNFVPPGFEGWASRQHIGTLSALMAKPHLTAAMREVVKMHLAAALNANDKLPESVKTYMWARAHNEHGGLGYQEFTDRNAKKDTPAEKIRTESAAREEEANRLGLDPRSPAGQQYVLTGKLGPEEKPDHKAIADADAAITAAQDALGSIREAISLSPKAFDGAFATRRGQITANFEHEGGIATLNLNNVVQSGALAQLKSIFGGNPTEGERKILLEVSGSAEQPRAVRDAIFARAEKAIERRLGIAMNKAAELRDRSYYKPGGGQSAASGQGQGTQANAGASGPKAPPAARYDELVGQGLSKQQAYQRMHEEGY